MISIAVSGDSIARDSRLFFKRGGDRDYMMRSEKRPGPANHQPPRRRRNLGTVFYIALTILLLVALFPVGLVLLWRRRIGWNGFTKLLASMTGALAFFVFVAYLLTMPLGNPDLVTVQQTARQGFVSAQQYAADRFDDLKAITAETADIAGRNLTAFFGHFDTIARVALDQGGDRAVVSVGALLSLPTPEPTPTPTPSPTPVPTPTPVRVAYVSDNSVIYHLDPSCASNLNPIPLSQAVAQGLIPCVFCALDPSPSPAPTVAPTAAPTATPATVQSSAAHAQTVEPSQTPNSTVSPTAQATLKPTAKPSPTPAITAVPTTDPALIPTVKPMGETLVWYTSNGRYYHRASTCGTMSNASQHTLLEAIEDGLSQCPYCHPVPEDILKAEVAVWVNDDTHLFHITDECEQLSDSWTALSLEDAMAAGYTPCEECGAYHYVNGLPLPGKLAATTQPDETLQPSADGSVIVYVSDKSQYYHKRSACLSLQSLIPKALQEAVAAGKLPCPDCDPPALSPETTD